MVCLVVFGCFGHLLKLRSLRNTSRFTSDPHVITYRLDIALFGNQCGHTQKPSPVRYSNKILTTEKPQSTTTTNVNVAVGGVSFASVLTFEMVLSIYNSSARLQQGQYGSTRGVCDTQYGARIGEINLEDMKPMNR